MISFYEPSRSAPGMKGRAEIIFIFINNSTVSLNRNLFEFFCCCCWENVELSIWPCRLAFCVLFNRRQMKQKVFARFWTRENCKFLILGYEMLKRNFQLPHTPPERCFCRRLNNGTRQLSQWLLGSLFVKFFLWQTRSSGTRKIHLRLKRSISRPRNELWKYPETSKNEEEKKIFNSTLRLYFLLLLQLFILRFSKGFGWGRTGGSVYCFLLVFWKQPAEASETNFHAFASTRALEILDETENGALEWMEENF